MQRVKGTLSHQRDLAPFGAAKQDYIAKCARPVLFQNEDAGWPLSNGGTCFIVNFRDRHFVVTAKHVLNLGNFELGQFRVQYRPDLNQCLPLNAVLYDGIPTNLTSPCSGSMRLRCKWTSLVTINRIPSEHLIE